MNKRIIKMAFAGFLVLGMAMPFAAANHGGGHGRGGYGHGDDFQSKFFWKAYYALENASALGLSEKQQEEIKSLKFDVKKNLIKQEADIAILKLDIKQLMYGRSVDTEAVNKLIDQKYELKKAKSKFLVDAIAQLKKNLTDDQYKKMKALKDGASYPSKKN